MYTHRKKEIRKENKYGCKCIRKVKNKGGNDRIKTLRKERMKENPDGRKERKKKEENKRKKK